MTDYNPKLRMIRIYCDKSKCPKFEVYYYPPGLSVDFVSMEEKAKVLGWKFTKYRGVHHHSCPKHTLKEILI